MNHLDQLEQYIEALIFASQQALSIKDITDAIKVTFEVKISKEDIESYIELITVKYQNESFAMQLMPIAGGYMFMSKPQYHKIIGDYLRQNERKKLSKAALETLAIIAYKQPITCLLYTSPSPRD